MSALAFLRSNKIILLAAVLALFVSSARAHVILDDPNGGEQLEVGSSFTVTWHIQIAHNLQNWDLWYSTTGSNGPWTTIAMNLPPGSGAVDSVHTYDWTVPNVVDDSVWLRVRMDNSGTDYYDVSAAPFSIVAPSIPGDLDGDGVVGILDLLSLLAAWGDCPAKGECPADLDGDGSVGILDLLALLANWG
ncbi:MAG: hypothetical protein IH983_08385 [Planctomycetes bacterium]|nr:hypothetical protein [Planctomycetota bacterium]